MNCELNKLGATFAGHCRQRPVVSWFDSCLGEILYSRSRKHAPDIDNALTLKALLLPALLYDIRKALTETHFTGSRDDNVVINDLNFLP